MPPVRSRLQVETELTKTIRECKQCETGSETQQRKRRRIDELLDEWLAQMDAHAPACRCDSCLERLGRFRHLGECEHPEDVVAEGW